MARGADFCLAKSADFWMAIDKCGQTMRPELPAPAQAQDALLRAHAQMSRIVGRAAAAISKSRRTLSTEARQPLVHLGPRHPGRLGSRSRRPAFLQHPRDQQPAAIVVEPRISMGHRESSSVARP